MTTMILGVFVILALCVLIVIKRIDYREEANYFYENILDEYGENEEYTSEYIDYSKAYQPKWLFSYNEKAFYHKLRTFADRNGLFLFAKVRLLDLVEPRRGQQKYKTYFYKIQAKHVDFVLCDAKLVARWVIELDDTSHRRADRVERDTFVDKVLMSTGYTILHMDSFDEKLLEREIIGIDAQ